jgi:hypothetical protein
METIATKAASVKSAISVISYKGGGKYCPFFGLIFLLLQTINQDNTMKSLDTETIEPVLEQVMDYFKNSSRSSFKGIDFDKDQILEALVPLLVEISQDADKRRKKVLLPLNHGKKWSDKLNQRLEQFYINGFNYLAPKRFYIAASVKFGRTAGAIKYQLLKMYLITDPYDPGYVKRKLKELRHQNS